MSEFAIHSNQVLLDGNLQNATIRVADGKIVEVVTRHHEFEGIPNESIGDKALLPGLIDCHVHINEPGRTDWEGFETATKAAAAGGITMLVDMPLNSSPVSTDREKLEQKVNAAKGKLYTDCGFWGGVVPGNADDLKGLADAGVLGYKCFLSPSGIDEFPNVTEADLDKALEIIKKTGRPLLAHAELESPHAGQELLAKAPQSYQAYLASRPKIWENEAIALLIYLCEKHDTFVHIVHLSSAEALPMIRTAKASGLPLTVETCPQYLLFDAESIPDGDTRYKCAPPIRDKANQELLWEAVLDGTIDFVVTDHSPAPPELKEIESGDFAKAWGGIASVQFSLPVMWTAAKARGMKLGHLVNLMSGDVADFIGLGQYKGQIAVGQDADLIVFDPDAEFTVTKEMIQFRHKVTPFEGQKLTGKVEKTWVSGEVAFDGNDFAAVGQSILLR